MPALDRLISRRNDPDLFLIYYAFEIPLMRAVMLVVGHDIRYFI